MFYKTRRLDPDLIEIVKLGARTLVLTPPLAYLQALAARQAAEQGKAAPQAKAQPPVEPEASPPLEQARPQHPLTVWRERRGLTLAAFGEIVGTTASTIWRTEQGKHPKPELAARIAAATDGRVVLTPPAVETWRQLLSGQDREHIRDGVAKVLLPRGHQTRAAP